MISGTALLVFYRSEFSHVMGRKTSAQHLLTLSSELKSSQASRSHYKLLARQGKLVLKLMLVPDAQYEEIVVIVDLLHDNLELQTFKFSNRFSK